MIETERLILRKMTYEDFPDLKKILSDIEVMYAWEHAFSDDEVTNWINNQIKRYEETGIGFLLAIEKITKQVVGQAGLIREKINGQEYWGIGYIFNKVHWGKGYATEAAKGCMDYAVNILHADQVICDIRPENTRSIAVAKRLGMEQSGEHIRNYNGKDMPHIIFVKRK